MTEEDAYKYYNDRRHSSSGIIYILYNKEVLAVPLLKAKELNICYQCGIAPKEKRYANCDDCLNTGKQSVAERIAKNKAFK